MHALILVLDFPTILDACLNSLKNVVDSVVIFNCSNIMSAVINNKCSKLNITSIIKTLTKEEYQDKTEAELHWMLYQYASEFYEKSSKQVFMSLNAMEHISFPQCQTIDPTTSIKRHADILQALTFTEEDPVPVNVRLQVKKYVRMLPSPCQAFVSYEPRMLLSHLTKKQYDSLQTTSVLSIECKEIFVLPTDYDPCHHAIITNTFDFFCRMYHLQYHKYYHKSHPPVFQTPTENMIVQTFFTDFAYICHVISDKLLQHAHKPDSLLYLSVVHDPSFTVFKVPYINKTKHLPYVLQAWNFITYKLYVYLGMLPSITNKYTATYWYLAYTSAILMDFQFSSLFAMLKQVLRFEPYHVDANTHLLAYYNGLKFVYDVPHATFMYMNMTVLEWKHLELDPKLCKKFSKAYIQNALVGWKLHSSLPSIGSLARFVNLYKHLQLIPHPPLEARICSICYEDDKQLGWMFPCLHSCCESCCSKLTICAFCRAPFYAFIKESEYQNLQVSSDFRALKHDSEQIKPNCEKDVTHH